MLMVVLDGMLKGLVLIVGQMLRDVPVNAHDDRSIRLRSMAAIEVANSLFSLFSLYGSLTSQEHEHNMSMFCLRMHVSSYQLGRTQLAHGSSLRKGSES